MKEMNWMFLMAALLTLCLLGLSWYMLLSTAEVFDAVRFASPAIEAYTGHLMGVVLLPAAGVIWALFRVHELEHRLRLLEEEWEEVDLGGEENDEIEGCA